MFALQSRNASSAAIATPHAPNRLGFTASARVVSTHAVTLVKGDVACAVAHPEAFAGAHVSAANILAFSLRAAAKWVKRVDANLEPLDGETVDEVQPLTAALQAAPLAPQLHIEQVPSISQPQLQTAAAQPPLPAADVHNVGVSAPPTSTVYKKLQHLIVEYLELSTDTLEAVFAALCQGRTPSNYDLLSSRILALHTFAKSEVPGLNVQQLLRRSPHVLLLTTISLQSKLLELRQHLQNYDLTEAVVAVADELQHQPAQHLAEKYIQFADQLPAFRGRPVTPLFRQQHQDSAAARQLHWKVKKLSSVWGVAATRQLLTACPQLVNEEPGRVLKRYHELQALMHMRLMPERLLRMVLVAPTLLLLPINTLRSRFESLAQQPPICYAAGWQPPSSRSPATTHSCPQPPQVVAPRAAQPSPRWSPGAQQAQAVHATDQTKPSVPSLHPSLLTPPTFRPSVPSTDTLGVSRATGQALRPSLPFTSAQGAPRQPATAQLNAGSTSSSGHATQAGIPTAWGSPHSTATGVSAEPPRTTLNGAAAFAAAEVCRRNPAVLSEPAAVVQQLLQQLMELAQFRRSWQLQFPRLTPKLLAAYLHNSAAVLSQMEHLLERSRGGQLSLRWIITYSYPGSQYMLEVLREPRWVSTQHRRPQKGPRRAPGTGGAAPAALTGGSQVSGSGPPARQLLRDVDETVYEVLDICTCADSALGNLSLSQLLDRLQAVTAQLPLRISRHMVDVVAACPRLLSQPPGLVGHKMRELQRVAQLQPGWITGLRELPPNIAGQYLGNADVALTRLEYLGYAGNPKGLTLVQVITMPESEWLAEYPKFPYWVRNGVHPRRRRRGVQRGVAV